MQFYLYLFLFIVFPFQIFSQEIVVGNIYESQIVNFMNKKINIPLPPGKWKAEKSSKSERQWWDAHLVNLKNEGEIFLTIPVTPIGGDGWSGGSMQRCRNHIKENAKAILSEGADRGIPQAIYCISERNDGFLHISLESRTTRTPIYCFYYDLYYHMNKIDKDLINNKNFLKEIGIIGMNGMTKGIKGSSTSFAYLEKLIKKKSSSGNQSSSSKKLSNLSNFSICRSALKNDGSGWVKYNDYVGEATSRSLTIYKCRDILNIKDKAEVKKKDNNTVKSKLEELKILLYDGLISKDQYDEKSSQLLDEL